MISPGTLFPIHDLATAVPLGSFRVVRKIGSGGMGDVFLALDPSGMEVALKVLHPQAASQPTLRKRFLREARATMALVHPNVVRILGTFEHDDTLVIAMELLRGQTLAEQLKARGKLTPSEAAELFCPIASALCAAHAVGIVHRDLKPENVFVTNDSPARVKVLDFGIAKLKTADVTSALTQTGMVVGTPFYMPPEQAFGESDVDHRADIWAFGLMLFEALSGQLPTRGASAAELLKLLLETEFPRLDQLEPAIPRDLAELVSHMIVRERSERLDDLRHAHRVLSEHRLGPSPAQAGAENDLGRSDLLTFDEGPLSPSIGGTTPLLSSPARTQRDEVVPSPRRRIEATQLDPELIRQLHAEQRAAAPIATVPIAHRSPQAPARPGPVIPPPATSERRPQRTGEWLWIGIGGGVVVLLLLVLLLR